MQRSERDKLIEDNMNLVYFTVNKYYPTYIRDEDMIQCGMIGLCNAADNYDEEKGAFSTYAVLCIRSEIVKEFRSRQRQTKLDPISLDTPIKVVGENLPISYMDTVIGDEDVGFVDIDGYYNTLTDYEKKYFNLLRSGYTQKELPSLLGCSRQNVSQVVRRLKAKWRAFNGN